MILSYPCRTQVCTVLQTLLEIFIFCPKIQVQFPVQIVGVFLGEKLVKMLWFWTF